MSLRDIISFLEREDAVVCVALSRVRGSSPREEGAVMYVSAKSMAGTIGGGQLEYMALDEARKLLMQRAKTCFMDVPLGPEIGQCCGGRVEVVLTRMDDAMRQRAVSNLYREDSALPHVYVFGAGHVGRALADQMQHLPVKCMLVDSRVAELDMSCAGVEKLLTPLPEAVVRNAPPQSAFIVLTHDHALDFLVSAEALRRKDAAYVGMIGSATKRAKFVRFLREQNDGTRVERLICPMASARLGDKRPEIIAAFVVAEVLDKLHKTTVCNASV